MHFVNRIVNQRIILTLLVLIDAGANAEADATHKDKTAAENFILVLLLLFNVLID